MGLVTTKEMLKKAYEGHYAVGAFNVNNMEIIQGVMEAVRECKSPVILQVSSSAIKYANPVYLKKMIEAAIMLNESAGVEIPVALHLDHGADFEICKFCIDCGFTSVMIDGSKYPFEENVALTKKVVEYAHKHGVSVEAEIGKLAGVEDDVKVESDDAMYTDPDEAYEFVKQTGCDSLAIAIGTSHGAYKFKGEPRLRYDILEKVAEKLPGFPIVLHGASSVPQEYVEKCNKYGGNLPGAKGVSDELLKKAGEMAVCKINMDSDIRLALTSSIRECFALTPEVFDPRTYLGAGREEIKKLVKHKICDVLCSNDKA